VVTQRTAFVKCVVFMFGVFVLHLIYGTLSRNRYSEAFFEVKLNHVEKFREHQRRLQICYIFLYTRSEHFE